MPSTSSTIPTLPCRQRTSQVAVLEPSARSQLRRPALTDPSRELASEAVLFRSSAKSTSDLFHPYEISGASVKVYLIAILLRCERRCYRWSNGISGCVIESPPTRERRRIPGIGEETVYR